MKREDKELNELWRECAEKNENIKNIQKSIELLKSYMKMMERFPERSKQSEMDKKVLLIRELVWINQMSRIPGKSQDFLRKHKSDVEVEVEVEAQGEDYEQLTLPGCEMDPGEAEEAGRAEKVKKKVSVNLFHESKSYRKVASKRTMNEILIDHGRQWLLDYNKYLGVGIPVKASKETLAKEIVEWIIEHPLQLLLALPKSSTKLLRKLADMEEGTNISITERNVDDFTQMMVWGLLDAGIVYQDEEVSFGISVPESVRERILPRLENITREEMEQSDTWCYYASSGDEPPGENEFWDSIHKFSDDIILMLKQYGVLDAETFHRFFTEIYQVDLTKKQLMRFVYLWGTFHRRLLTGKLVTGKEIFVGSPKIDIDSVIIKREKYCKDIPYKCQTEADLAAGVSQVMELWDALSFAFEDCELDEEEIWENMMDGHRFIQEGMSVADIMGYFLDQFEMYAQVDFAMLWRQLVWIGLSTPLPMLNGYSRLSFQEEYGRYQYLDLFRGTDKRVRKAALYELPVELQEQLADLVFMSETADYDTLKKAEEKLPFACMHNEQAQIFLAVNRLAAYGNIQDEKKKDTAQKELRKMILDLCEECRDEDTFSTLMELAAGHGIFHMVDERGSTYGNERDTDYFWGDEWVEPAAPIVKAERIYPNDPCPCGSGKKFKKCCKEKGIYD